MSRRIESAVAVCRGSPSHTGFAAYLVRVIGSALLPFLYDRVPSGASRAVGGELGPGSHSVGVILFAGRRASIPNAS
jgi:hypothetical protein